jgi:hypothetical protein
MSSWRPSFLNGGLYPYPNYPRQRASTVSKFSFNQRGNPQHRKSYPMRNLPAHKKRFKRNSFSNMNYRLRASIVSLKGQLHEIFDPRFFFHQSTPTRALIHSQRPFRICHTLKSALKILTTMWQICFSLWNSKMSVIHFTRKHTVCQKRLIFLRG